MSYETSRVKVDISLSAILKILAVIFGLLFLHKIQDILLLLFVVLIMVTALSPVIDQLVKNLNIPRWLAVAMIFGGIAVIFVLMIWLILPLMVNQVLELLSQPEIKNLLGGSDSNSAVDELKLISGQIPGLSQGGAGVVSFLSTLFGGVVSVLTVLVLTIYLLLDEDGIKKFIISVIPTHHKTQIVSTLHKISLKIGSWLRGQLLLGLIVGLIDLAILLVFGVPYWLTLAIFAGLTELIPYVGPFIGLGAALFVAFTKDSLWGISHVTAGIGVLVGYLLVQQLESNFLVPKVMEKTVGLSPVIVIIAILIGAKLFGLVGVILSIPVAGALSVVIDEWPAIQAAYLSNKADIKKAIAKE